MTDISKTIEPKTDQLNADDFLVDERPMTITVTNVRVVGGDQPVIINYEGDNGKPYKPGKSMRRALSVCWGVKGELWVGRKMTLYRDPTVRFGSDAVGGIRISHLSHITSQFVIPLTVTRGQKKPYTIKPLKMVDAPANKPTNQPQE